MINIEISNYYERIKITSKELIVLALTEFNMLQQKQCQIVKDSTLISLVAFLKELKKSCSHYSIVLMAKIKGKSSILNEINLLKKMNKRQ